MIKDTPSGNKLTGFYRGLVIELLTHGYCKIFIPGVNPREWKDKPDMLPPAEQATSLFGGANNGNGEFSYPNLSSMVWCFFANGDLNMPVYFASSLGGQNAFGQFELAKKVDDKEGKKHILTSGKSQVKIEEDGKIEISVKDPDLRESKVAYGQESYFPLYSKKIKEDKVEERPIADKVDSCEISNINCNIKFDVSTDLGTVDINSQYFNKVSSSNEVTSIKAFSKHNNKEKYADGIAILSTDGASSRYEFNSTSYSDIVGLQLCHTVINSISSSGQLSKQYKDGITLSKNGIIATANGFDQESQLSASGIILLAIDDKSGIYLKSINDTTKYLYINYGNTKSGKFQIKIENTETKKKCYIDFNAEKGSILIDCPDCLTLHSKQISISADDQIDIKSGGYARMDAEVVALLSSPAIWLDASKGQAHVTTKYGKTPF